MKDVIVSGAGPVGLVTSYYLASLGYKVHVFEPNLNQLLQINLQNLQPAAQALQTLQDGDFRYISLNHGSYLLLQSIGIDINCITQPIKQVYISNAGYFGHCCMQASQYNVPALAYAVHYQSLQTYLYSLCKQSAFKHAITWHAQSMPEFEVSESLKINETIPATNCSTQESSLNLLKLLNLVKQANYRFICEGGLFNKTQINNKEFSYIDQHQYAHIGLANLQKNDSYSQKDQKHTAWERFTKQGPIALLPCAINYQNQTYNHIVVWCNTSSHLPDALQTKDLQNLLGNRANLQTIDWQQSYALGVKLRKQSEAYKTAYIGNALQAIHPVAGQGLNLGLRQALRVVDAFHQHASLQEKNDLSDNLHWQNFQPYSSLDKFDQQAILQATKGMAHGFKYHAISCLLGLGLQTIGYSKLLNGIVARLFLYGVRGL